MTVCLVILNFEGIHHLEHLLPTALKAVEVYGEPCPIVVLDNQSRTQDVEWLRSHYPQVKVSLAPKNDYLFSYNDYLKQRSEDVVVLLNSDLRLDEGFISPLLEHFRREDTFGVSSLSYDWSGLEITSGPAVLKSHHDWVYVEYEKKCLVSAFTLFPVGGYAAVDRRKFLELGGFDRLFYPAYGEDFDLGFRAWIRGWKSVYEPKSRVWHRENGSMTSEKAKHLIMVSQFLFQWKNLKPSWSRTLWIQWRRLRSYWRADRSYEKAYQEAVARWRQYSQESPQQAQSLKKCREMLSLLGRAC